MSIWSFWPIIEWIGISILALMTCNDLERRYGPFKNYPHDKK